MSSLAVGSPDPGFGVAAQFSTLVDLLEWRARLQPERVAYTFLVDNGKFLPVWRALPPLALWFVPSVIGLPILVYNLIRHPLVRRA